jgi:hypothetical protein
VLFCPFPEATPVLGEPDCSFGAVLPVLGSFPAFNRLSHAVLDLLGVLAGVAFGVVAD